MHRAEYLNTPGKMFVRAKCRGPGGQSPMSTLRKAKSCSFRKKWNCANQFRTIRAIIWERSLILIMTLGSNQAWKKLQWTYFRERQSPMCQGVMPYAWRGPVSQGGKILENNLLRWLTKRRLLACVALMEKLVRSQERIRNSQLLLECSVLKTSPCMYLNGRDWMAQEI